LALASGVADRTGFKLGGAVDDPALIVAGSAADAEGIVTLADTSVEAS
jgi:hypothetical protein